MKKLIAILLALTVVCSFAACGNTNNEPEVKLPASALEVMETVWASYGEDEMFFAMGGGYESLTDGKPGAVAATDTDTLQFMLLVPEAQLSSVTEAASLLHAMNANTFTGATFKVADAAAFVTAMQTAVQNNQWMCGFPEELLIVTFGNEFATVVFGNGELVANFQSKLTAAYPDAVIAVSEPIA